MFHRSLEDLGRCLKSLPTSSDQNFETSLQSLREVTETMTTALADGVGLMALGAPPVGLPEGEAKLRDHLGTPQELAKKRLQLSQKETDLLRVTDEAVYLATQLKAGMMILSKVLKDVGINLVGNGTEQRCIGIQTNSANGPKAIVVELDRPAHEKPFVLQIQGEA